MLSATQEKKVSNKSLPMTPMMKATDSIPQITFSIALQAKDEPFEEPKKKEKILKSNIMRKKFISFISDRLSGEETKPIIPHPTSNNVKIKKIQSMKQKPWFVPFLVELNPYFQIPLYQLPIEIKPSTMFQALRAAKNILKITSIKVRESHTM